MSLLSFWAKKADGAAGAAGAGGGKRGRDEGGYDAGGAASASPAQASKAAKAEQATRDPRSVVIWNANGLHHRLEKNGPAVQRFLEQHQPDALLLSEVWLKGAQGAQGEVWTGDAAGRGHQGLWARATRGGGVLEWFSGGARQLTLNHARRGAGSAMLARDEARPLRTWCYLPPHDEIVRGVEPQRTHEPEGRILLIEWPSVLVLHQYVPNNGSTEESYIRRKAWDGMVLEWLRVAHQQRDLFGKFARIVFCGDLNIAPEDADVSHPGWFRTQGADHQGQPGYTPLERERFRHLLREAGLVDAYRHFQALRDEEFAPVAPREIADPIFTWRGWPSRPGNVYNARYEDRGMRIDHFLVSRALLVDVADVEILGRGANAADPSFLGSDHCPMVLTFLAGALAAAAPQPAAAPAPAPPLEAPPLEAPPLEAPPLEAPLEPASRPLRENYGTP
jgi:exodeoxyribonuclease III